MAALVTARLELRPLSLPLVEAVLGGRREEAEAVAGARFPPLWPGRALVEQALACPVERLRSDPASFLWGGRLIVRKPAAPGDDPFVVGSVILSGPPDPSGSVEVGYGIEAQSQGKGYATEGTRAVVDWALAQRDVARVAAATMPWHTASLRVLAKIGMEPAGTRPHDVFGELLVFEKRRPS